MKHLIGKKRLAAIITLAILFVLCWCGIFISYQGQEKASADNEPFTIVYTADRNTVAPGGSFTLTMTITTTLPGNWMSIGSILAGPMNSDNKIDTTLAPYLSASDFTLGSEFQVPYYMNSSVDKFQNASFNSIYFSLYCPDLGMGYVATTTPLRATALVTLAEDFPSNVKQMTFSSVSNSSNNGVGIRAPGAVVDTNYTANKGYLSFQGVTITVDTGSQEQVPDGKFTSLEYSTNNGSSWNTIFDDGYTSTDFNTTSLTFSKSFNISTVPVGTDIFFKGTAADGVTIITGDRLKASTTVSGAYYDALTFGENRFFLTAQQSSSNSTAYNFVITLVEDKNTIENIMMTDANGAAISGFTFSKTTYNYSVSVPFSTNSVSLKVTVDGEYTKVQMALDNATLGGANKVFSMNRSIVQGGPSAGNNTIVLHAVANNGAGASGSNYTISITRNSASSDTTLSSLSTTLGSFRDVNDSTDVTFDPNVTDYYVFNKGGAASMTINASANDAGAQVSGTGTKTFSGGSGTQTFSVTVTAEDGTTKTYNIHVVNDTAPDFSGDYTITSLSVQGNDGVTYLAAGSFNAATKTYTVNVPYSVSAVNVNVTAPNAANIVGQGMQSISVGSNQIEVYAVAQDGTNGNGADKYIINITREAASIDAYLADLAINGITVTGFNKLITEYTAGVDYSVTSVQINAQASDTSATVSIYQNGTPLVSNTSGASSIVTLGAEGSTLTLTINVTVDGTTKPYTLMIVRGTQLPKLAYLYVNGYSIFDKDGREIDGYNPDPFGLVKDFYVEVPYNVTNLNVVARSSDVNSITRVDKYEGTNGEASGDFTVGTDIFVATLDAELNIVIRPKVGVADAIYYLHIKKKPSPTSNVNADITINNTTSGSDHKIDEFNSEYTNDYDLYGYYNVAYTVNYLDMKVVPEYVDELHALATYKVYYNNRLRNDNGTEYTTTELDYGVNIVRVDILASDGYTKRTVGIVVVRGDICLNNPYIVEIPEFQSEYTAEKNEYFYTINNNVKKLTIGYVPQDGLWVVTEGADKLSVGLNEIHIYMYSLSANYTGSTTASSTAVSTANTMPDPIKTITLQVYREGSNIWQILFFILLVICIIEFFIIIALAVSNRHLKQRIDDMTRVSNPNPPQQVYKQMPMPQYQPVPVQVPVQQVVRQVPVQQVPVQQQVRPVYVQTAKQASSASPMVEVKISGMGETDGIYDAYGRKK